MPLAQLSGFSTVNAKFPPINDEKWIYINPWYGKIQPASQMSRLSPTNIAFSFIDKIVLLRQSILHPWSDKTWLHPNFSYCSEIGKIIEYSHIYHSIDSHYANNEIILIQSNEITYVQLFDINYVKLIRSSNIGYDFSTNFAASIWITNYVDNTSMTKYERIPITMK